MTIYIMYDEVNQLGQFGSITLITPAHFKVGARWKSSFYYIAFLFVGHELSFVTIYSCSSVITRPPLPASLKQNFERTPTRKVSSLLST